jgi:hypothetical protein
VDRAADSASELVKPATRLLVLGPLAGVSDIAGNEQTMRGSAWKSANDLGSVGDELLFHIIMDMDGIVTFLAEMDI